MPDIKSTLVAALVGAFFLAGVVLLFKALAIITDEETSWATWLAIGAVTGAGVQIAVRVTGVS